MRRRYIFHSSGRSIIAAHAGWSISNLPGAYFSVLLSGRLSLGPDHRLTVIFLHKYCKIVTDSFSTHVIIPRIPS